MKKVGPRLPNGLKKPEKSELVTTGFSLSWEDDERLHRLALGRQMSRTKFFVQLLKEEEERVEAKASAFQV